VFRDRLFEKFRAEQAASYSPDTSSQWPEDMAGNGYFFAYAQVKPGDVERFYAFANSVAKDLAVNPVGADELSRTIEPLRQEIERVSSGNSFWLDELKGATNSQDRIAALTHLMTDYTSVTPALLQQMAKEYLVPDKSWKLQIVPKS
jgi:zinc protease